MDNNIEEKLKNLEEWYNERSTLKPLIDIAVDFHQKARAEASWRRYEQADSLYKKAIENYKKALNQQPKYYLQSLLERIDDVIGEYINNIFNLKTTEDRLSNDAGINEFIDFIHNLKAEERRYIDPYIVAKTLFRIADLYNEKKNFDKALEFYKKVVEINCERPFINRDAHIKIGLILFDRSRFKEAVEHFVSVLSYDRDNKEAIFYLDAVLRRLGIFEHREEFLKATPNEAKKLIMEVL